MKRATGLLLAVAVIGMSSGCSIIDRLFLLNTDGPYGHHARGGGGGALSAGRRGGGGHDGRGDASPGAGRREGRGDGWTQRRADRLPGSGGRGGQHTSVEFGGALGGGHAGFAGKGDRAGRDVQGGGRGKNNHEHREHERHQHREHERHQHRHHHHHHRHYHHDYPWGQYFHDDIWIQAPVFGPPYWLAPYETHLYPKESPSANQLHCIAQTCIQNFAETSDSVPECICQGIRSRCADFPSSYLCTDAIRTLPAESTRCLVDAPGATWNDSLWQRAARNLDAEACG